MRPIRHWLARRRHRKNLERWRAMCAGIPTTTYARIVQPPTSTHASPVTRYPYRQPPRQENP